MYPALHRHRQIDRRVPSQPALLHAPPALQMDAASAGGDVCRMDGHMASLVSISSKITTREETLNEVNVLITRINDNSPNDTERKALKNDAINRCVCRCA